MMYAFVLINLSKSIDWANYCLTPILWLIGHVWWLQVDLRVGNKQTWAYTMQYSRFGQLWVFISDHILFVAINNKEMLVCIELQTFIFSMLFIILGPFNMSVYHIIILSQYTTGIYMSNTGLRLTMAVKVPTSLLICQNATLYCTKKAKT